MSWLKNAVSKVGEKAEACLYRGDTYIPISLELLGSSKFAVIFRLGFDFDSHGELECLGYD